MRRLQVAIVSAEASPDDGAGSGGDEDPACKEGSAAGVMEKVGGCMVPNTSFAHCCQFSIKDGNALNLHLASEWTRLVRKYRVMYGQRT